MASLAMATAAGTAPPFHFDEKWKLSKKESSSRSRSSSSSCSSSSTSSIMKGSTSRRRCAFTRKCARLVREQRAKFYIMRRCVTMLICWHEYGDS
ncbi:hypothetical protein BT93_J0852 [Corymbia citriodora subsp. variegata]|nr:hypothetical protein BT93_J0852 [Corymbia citriodora subsp. variegata]